MLAGNDPRADGDFLAVSMDVMCAATTVLVSAIGSGRVVWLVQKTAVASVIILTIAAQFGHQ